MYKIPDKFRFSVGFYAQLMAIYAYICTMQTINGITNQPH